MSLLAFQHQVNNSNLGPFTKLVAMVLSTFADKHTLGNCFPNYRHLAKCAGIALGSVSKAIRELEAAGFIQIFKCSGFKRGWRRHRYQLLLARRVHGREHHKRRTPYKNKTNNFNHTENSLNCNRNDAKQVWKSVIDQIKRFGRYRLDEIVLPEAVREAIKRIGGFGRLCSATLFDLEHKIFLEFQKNY